jgi:hypothetical protein
VKKRLTSWAYLLPLLEILFSAATILVPALLIFFRLKQMAHGAGSVSLSSGEFEMTIPSKSFLTGAFYRAGGWAEGPITILNAPAIFVEVFVALLVAHKQTWYPAASLSLPVPWHALIYPIYALPSWFYVGLGIDGVMGRYRVRGWNAALSVLLALTCAALYCGTQWVMPEIEGQGQPLLSWFLGGFALWAVLFAIPFAAWVLRRKRKTDC